MHSRTFVINNGVDLITNAVAEGKTWRFHEVIVSPVSKPSLKADCPKNFTVIHPIDEATLEPVGLRFLVGKTIGMDVEFHTEQMNDEYLSVNVVMGQTIQGFVAASMFLTVEVDGVVEQFALFLSTFSMPLIKGNIVSFGGLVRMPVNLMTALEDNYSYSTEDNDNGDYHD